MMGFARVIANDLARDFRVGIAAELDALANKVGANAVRVHKRAIVRKRDEHLSMADIWGWALVQLPMPPLVE